MSRIGEALRAASRALGEASDTPRLDAELLLAHALGIEREGLLLGPPDRPVPPGFGALVERRAAGEPLAYLTGRRAFWTIELGVAPGVLIPRPDSETLIEAAVAHFAGGDGPRRVLDLGTGSGALLLAALDQWPGASGVGIDCSPVAVEIARANARSLGLAERCRIRLGDWHQGISERFDLLLCNPPYVAAGAELDPGVAANEPPQALFAGADGLDSYRRLAPGLEALLAPGGIALFEIGHDQAAGAAGLFALAGWQVGMARDLGGRPRALLIQAKD